MSDMSITETSPTVESMAEYRAEDDTIKLTFSLANNTITHIFPRTQPEAEVELGQRLITELLNLEIVALMKLADRIREQREDEKS